MSEAVSSRLSDYIPPIESVPDAGEQGLILPPLEMDMRRMREILQHGQLTEEERVGRLLVLVRQARTIVERPLPSTLIGFVPQAPDDWYYENAPDIEMVMNDPASMSQVYELTAPLNTAPMLRASAWVRDIAGSFGSENVGRRTDLAARMLTLEGMRSTGLA